MQEFTIILSSPEIKKCLKEITIRLQRILYVYEQSLINDKYDYKSYIYSVVLYISSVNHLLNYDLINIIINLNTILNNDLDKKQIKKIILDSKHILNDIKKGLE